MKARFFTAALVIALPGMAHAQSNSDDETVNVAGTVAGLCMLGTPSRTAVPLGQLINLSGPRTGKLIAVADQQITLPGSFCNFPGTSVRVSAQAMLSSDTAAVQPGFARAVNFTSIVTNWVSQDATATTAASAGGANPAAVSSGGTQSAPRIADLTLTLNGFVVPSDLLLVAGDYTGSVTITLGPAATP